MIRKLMMVGMLVMLLSATSQAFAEDVFITKNGAKYHAEICRLVKNKENVSTLDKKQAIEKGYTPCKRCFKEGAVAENGEQ